MKRKRPTPRPRPLTRKQLRFIEAYIARKGNGIQAAMEAYDCRNRNTAHTIASENLQKPAIAAEIGRRMEWDPSVGEAGSVLKEALRAKSHWTVAAALRRTVRLWRRTM